MKQINSEYVDTSCVMCKVCSKEFTFYDYNVSRKRKKETYKKQKRSLIVIILAF